MILISKFWESSNSVSVIQDGWLVNQIFRTLLYHVVFLGSTKFLLDLSRCTCRLVGWCLASFCRSRNQIWFQLADGWWLLSEVNRKSSISELRQFGSKCHAGVRWCKTVGISFTKLTKLHLLLRSINLFDYQDWFFLGAEIDLGTAWFAFVPSLTIAFFSKMQDGPKSYKLAKERKIAL
jgi:hypothetical protein